jgi:hypothetical protein
VGLRKIFGGRGQITFWLKSTFDEKKIVHFENFGDLGNFSGGGAKTKLNPNFF